MSEYITKDSGARIEFESGMVRDTQEGKPRYDLLDRAFLRRWALLMGRGAEKYGEENWRKAAGPEELRRFKASAARHFFQWLDGETDEDHGAAVAFNIAGADWLERKLAECVKDRGEDHGGSRGGVQGDTATHVPTAPKFIRCITCGGTSPHGHEKHITLTR